MEGITFTVADKLKIVKKLDEFGIDYIEAGNPGSNPKDIEFFNEIKKLKLKNSRLAAFGSTRRAGMKTEEDKNVIALLDAGSEVITIFGKTWDMHVTKIIKTTMEENLFMIKDTIAFFKGRGKEVIFDAEHFFDGYKANSMYAMSSLQAAIEGGADCLVLCDTNGGSFPEEIGNIVKIVSKQFDKPIGIHCHNDCGMAVGNSITAVLNGAVQIQGTINGYGERCGNANLCTVIPNLQLKKDFRTIPKHQLSQLTSLSRYISEVANMSHNENEPYVGNNAFAHKGGMHIDAVIKDPFSFEHISPEAVGNKRRILMSEVSGRSTILKKIQAIEPTLTKDSEKIQEIIDLLKRLEHSGYQFEGAESSFELIVRKAMGKHKKFFSVMDFYILSQNQDRSDLSATAVIKVEVNGREEITASEGDGPVNALDCALRKALEIFYPELRRMRLNDYKVRVLDTEQATAAKVRVHIESTDGQKIWGTVGVSTNIIEASFTALIDSIEYFIMSCEKNNEIQVAGELEKERLIEGVF